MSRQSEVDANGDDQSPTPPALPGPGAVAVADKIFERVRHTFGEQISPENVMMLVLDTMEASEQVKNIPGPKRKKIAIGVMHRLLDEIPDHTENRHVVVGAMKLLLPGMIDAIIAAAKGQVDLGRKVKRVFGCC